MPDFRWTAEQLRVILESRNTLLAASAGTGKTRTIVGKVVWMLGLDAGTGPGGEPVPRVPRPCGLDQIAAITFTERAACELRGRLREAILAAETGDRLRWQLDRAAIGTIHGFAAGLLRDHALRLGIDPTFRVLDEAEATLGLRDVIRTELIRAAAGDSSALSAISDRVRLDGDARRPGLVQLVGAAVHDLRWHADRYAAWCAPASAAPELALDSLAELASRHGIEAAEADVAAMERAGGIHRLAHRSLGAWLSWMEAENVRDFDSLILDARRLLTRPEHRPALVAMRESLRILIIDEFQDTDAAQRDIAFALAGIGDPEAGDCPQLVLVGDPKQSIFRFRGADIGVWNEVRTIMERQGTRHDLTENFRAQPGLVGFTNAVCGAAVDRAAVDVTRHDPGQAIRYHPLVAHRRAGPGQGVDWLDCSAAGGRDAVTALEARLLASRLTRLLDAGRLPDEASGEARPVRPSDVAVLGRTRRALDAVDGALRSAGVPVYNAARLGLAERSEIRDLVTLLRLLADPEDDVHALALLRSPFVGLRDEVIARIRLGAERSAPLFEQARRWMDGAGSGAGWFGAPEHERIADIERQALRRALAFFDDGVRLVDRATPAELVESALQATGYRIHLELREGTAEALAAIERFLGLLDGYRHLPLRGVLDLWDRWGALDLGIGEASAHGAAGEVVTLQTIHTAKGLEWPIVALVGAGSWDFRRDRHSGEYVSDAILGPVLMPSSSERGPRAAAIAARASANAAAEEARLLYVALTRAADRLIVSAPDTDASYMEFLRAELADAVAPHQAAREEEDRAGRSSRSGATAGRPDPATGTGRQIEAFAGGGDQLDIFLHEPSAPASADARLVPVVYRSSDPEQGAFPDPQVGLAWLDLVRGPPEPEAPPTPATPPLHFVTSASELQLRALDRDAWKLRYVHGVEETWRFVPGPDEAGVPAALRGVIIHGVLERIRSVEELARILDETIVAVDAPPGSEALLSPGTTYRRALEQEIAGVVAGSEWHFYVEGDHERELRFLVPRDERWCQGAIDLYNPGIPLIVDFKTHVVSAEAVSDIADRYQVQAAVYRDAVASVTGRSSRVVLHFTHSNAAVEAARGPG